MQVQALALSACGKRSGLSSPSSLNPPLSTPETVVTHIAWSTYQSDLAVVDSTGRISVFCTIIPVNQLLLAGTFPADEDTALGTIVGLEWLMLNRQVMSIEPALVLDAKRILGRNVSCSKKG